MIGIPKIFNLLSRDITIFEKLLEFNTLADFNAGVASLLAAAAVITADL